MTANNRPQTFLFKKSNYFTLQKKNIDELIKPMCKLSIYRKISVKLTNESIFTVKSYLVKQVKACPMQALSLMFFFIFKYVKWKNLVVSAMLLFHTVYANRTYAERNILITNYSRPLIATTRTNNV